MGKKKNPNNPNTVLNKDVAFDRINKLYNSYLSQGLDGLKQRLSESYFNFESFEHPNKDEFKKFMSDKLQKLKEELFSHVASFLEKDILLESEMKTIGDKLRDKLNEFLENVTKELDEHFSQQVQNQQEQITNNVDDWVQKLINEEDFAIRKAHFEPIKRKIEHMNMDKIDAINDMKGYDLKKIEKIANGRTKGYREKVWKEYLAGLSGWTLTNEKDHNKIMEDLSRIFSKTSLFSLCKENFESVSVGDSVQTWLNAFLTINFSLKVVDLLLKECFDKLHNDFLDCNPKPFDEDEIKAIHGYIKDRFNNATEEDKKTLEKYSGDIMTLNTGIKDAEKKAKNAKEAGKKEAILELENLKKELTEKTKEENKEKNNICLKVRRKYINSNPKLKKCLKFFKEQSSIYSNNEPAAIFERVFVLMGSNYPRWWHPSSGKLEIAMIVNEDKLGGKSMESYDVTKTAKFVRSWKGSAKVLGCSGMQALDDLRKSRNMVAHQPAYLLDEKNAKVVYYTVSTALMAFSKAAVASPHQLQAAVEEARKINCFAKQNCINVNVEVLVRENFCCLAETLKAFEEEVDMLMNSPVPIFTIQDYKYIHEMWKKADEMNTFFWKLYLSEEEDDIQKKKSIGMNMIKDFLSRSESTTETLLVLKAFVFVYRYFYILCTGRTDAIRGVGVANFTIKDAIKGVSVTDPTMINVDITDRTGADQRNKDQNIS